MGHRSADPDQGEREEEDRVGGDQQRGALVSEPSRIALGEVADGEGDDDARHGQHKVRAPLQQPPASPGVTDGEQGHGQGQQGGERRGHTAVEGGVPARVEDGHPGQEGDSAGEHPVDAGTDRHAEGEGDQESERGKDRERGPAQPVPADRPLGLRSGALRPTLAPGDGLSAEDHAAQDDQHQREGAGGGHVEGDLELGEDLGGEGLVAEDLEGAVLGQDHKRDQDAAAEDGAARLPDGHAQEGADPAQPEAAGRVLQARVRAAQAGSDGKVDQGIDGQGHDQHRALEPLHPGRDRRPPEADHEVGDGEGDHQQHRPDAAAGEVGALHQPGRQGADHGAERGDHHREPNRVPEQGGGQRAPDEVGDGAGPGTARLDEEKEERGEQHHGDRAARPEQEERGQTPACRNHGIGDRRRLGGDPGRDHRRLGRGPGHSARDRTGRLTAGRPSASARPRSTRRPARGW